ncbi:MAG TPA: hypothetical protein VGI40_08180 [Pirellulaceae bacterium]
MIQRGEIGEDVAAFEVEERADDGGGFRQWARARDAGEAGEAGAAEDVEEDGFDLIVGGVGGGNVASAELAGGLREKVVAGLAGGGFEAVGGVGG